MNKIIAAFVLCGMLASPVMASNLRLFTNKISKKKFPIEYAIGVSKMTLDGWLAFQALTHDQFKELFAINTKEFVHRGQMTNQFADVSWLDLTNELFRPLKGMSSWEWHALKRLVSSDGDWDAFRELTDYELLKISQVAYKKKVQPREDREKLAYGLSRLIDYLTR